MIKKRYFYCFILFSSAFLYFNCLLHDIRSSYEETNKREQWQDLRVSEERDELNSKPAECEVSNMHGSLKHFEIRFFYKII